MTIYTSIGRLSRRQHSATMLPRPALSRRQGFMRSSASALYALLLLATVGMAHGQVQAYPDCPMLPVPEPAVLRENLLADLERRTVAALGAIQHADDRRELEEQRGPLREELHASLRLDRFPPADAADALTTGVLEREGYRVEKLVIPTLPGLWAPAHLYLPATLDEPAPAVLLAAGQWPEEGKAHPDAQAFGINMARQGFAVLVYDPLGFGERSEAPGDHSRADLLMVGIPPQGVVQYELRRSLDYLEAPGCPPRTHRRHWRRGRQLGCVTPGGARRSYPRRRHHRRDDRPARAHPHTRAAQQRMGRSRHGALCQRPRVAGPGRSAPVIAHRCAWSGLRLCRERIRDAAGRVGRVAI